MKDAIVFNRGGKNIIGEVILTTIEPLDKGEGRQVVFFCQDSDGKRYRVPKSQVLVMGRLKKGKVKK